jgi:hypothetical protein
MIFRDYTESMLKAINVIGMYVSDTMTSVSFYKDLGFEVISDDGIIGRVKLGGFELDFMAKDTANISMLKLTRLMRTLSRLKNLVLSHQPNQRTGHGGNESLLSATQIDIKSSSIKSSASRRYLLLSVLK